MGACVGTMVFVVVVTVVMEAEYSQKSLDLLSVWLKRTPLPLTKCLKRAAVHSLMSGCVKLKLSIHGEYLSIFELLY